MSSHVAKSFVSFKWYAGEELQSMQAKIYFAFHINQKTRFVLLFFKSEGPIENILSSMVRRRRDGGYASEVTNEIAKRYFEIFTARNNRSKNELSSRVERSPRNE